MRNGKQFPLLYAAYPDNPAIVGRDTVAARIRSHISFSRVDPKADMIKVSYQSPSPLEAAFLVNASMNIYTDLSRRTHRTASSSALNFLTRERKRVHNQLQGSTSKLQNFMNKSNLIQVDAQTQQLIQQIAALEASKHTAKTELVAANSAVEKYKNELNNIKPGLADQFSKAVGPSISRLQYALSEQKTKKAILLANYPKGKAKSSPELKKINGKIQTYQTKIHTLTKKLLGKMISI